MRWDRLGRVALLVVLALIVALYIGPARSYITTFGEAKDKRAEVARLEAERRALLERRAELLDPATLRREARRLGMVRPGERAFIVEPAP